MRQRLSVSAPPWRGLCALGLAGLLALGCDESSSDAPSDPLAPDGTCEALWEVQLRLGTRIVGPVAATFRFADYTVMADGQVLAPDGGACTSTLATRLADLCEPCRSDPGACEPAVRRVFAQVPPTCSACGDTVCLAGEDATNCPEDCLARCGDGYCVAPETDTSCPSDCQAACGDGLCVAAETPQSCPADCSFTVGDGVCSPGEGPANSPVDCRRLACGDGACQSFETAAQCPGDCCVPALCEPGVLACSASHDLAQCVANAAGNCPGFEPLETCELGCQPPDGDEPARCRRCADLLFELEGTAVNECTPGVTPLGCGEQCRALPGFAGCGVRENVGCGPNGICHEGQCVTCEDCVPEAQRCSPEGVPERCAWVTGTCRAWTTWGNDCPKLGLSCVEGAGEARCCSPQPCAAPGTAQCADGLTRVACNDDGICGGYETTEPCEGGWVCDVDPDDPQAMCAPCCTPGEARCAADGSSVQRCVTHPTVAACGQWSVETACLTGESCADAGSGPACVTPP